MQGENTVLKNIDLVVHPGDFVFLIGKTGSGKSSLIKTLYGDLNLESGQGQIVGYNLNKLKEKQIPHLRRKLGVVFQDFKLLSDRNIYDNLSFVLKATGWKKKRQFRHESVRFYPLLVWRQVSQNTRLNSREANNNVWPLLVRY